MPVLTKSFALTVASLWMVIGMDSSRVPYFHPAVWALAFIAVALGIAHTTFRPDRYKLRMVTAFACGVAVIRGASFSIDQERPGPAAVWLLIAMLSAAYYFARRDSLPEHYGNDDNTS